MQKSVLIVDDEPLIRSFLSHVLKMLNFTILEADREESAYHTFCNRISEIDFVITEIDLIYGSGLNLYTRIRNKSSSVMIVVCGDCMEYPIEEVQRDPNAVFLTKPFSVETLIQTTNRLTGAVKLPCSA
jgi:DNA-binding NtrC family response regulator